MQISGKEKIIFHHKSDLLVLFGTAILTLMILCSQVSLRSSNYSLKIGDVATQDITAPRTVTYVSDILTEEAKKNAENNINDIYLPADPTISRTQLQNLRLTFQFISTVRGDIYSTLPQKIDDINNISVTRFDETTITQLLELNQNDWTTLQDESTRVLESIMQNSIRDTQVLSEIENIPAMVNYYINQNVANLVASFVERFITANSLYSEELTEKSREEAREAVMPRERTYVSNQTVIQRGEIVTELIYEALNKMGLVTARNTRERLLAVSFLVIGLSAFFCVFRFYARMGEVLNTRSWVFLAGMFLLFVIIGRLTLPNHTILPFIFPISAIGMTIAVMFGRMPAIIVSIIASILIPFDFSNSVCCTVFYLVSVTSAIILMGAGRQISNFIIAGLISGLISAPILLGYQFVQTNIPNTIGLLTLAGVAVLNGIFSSAIALILQYVFSNAVGVVTPLRLMELIRPESPLLQILLQQAPGTYQHSLQVANLAEQAARDIGADSLLTRTGAMYHDIGKTENPLYFIENQAAGDMNLHEDLPPEQSAAAIIRHVSDGVHLAMKYHLPEKIIDFIREHHGTNQTRYQLGEAIQKYGEENVDPANFMYDGPKPQTKETALVMLADTTEARARAERPGSEEEIRNLVRSVINLYTGSGQMDDTPLTMSDLNIIRESFIHVLNNIYHQRVRYPGAQPDAAAKAKN